MSWAVVAQKDFEDAIRSKLTLGLTALFVLLVGGLAFAYGFIDGFGSGMGEGSSGFIVFLQGSGAFFVSIVALLVGYKAIAGERESGTLSFLLGLPHTRRDVVVGKVVGRAGVLVVALVSAFAVAAALLVGLGESFAPIEYLLFTLLTVLYAVSFVTVAVALSSMTASSSRAAAGAIGFWVFNQFWGALALVALVLVNGLSMPEAPWPDWYHAIAGLGPGAAYGNAAAFFLPEELTGQVQSQLGGLPEWYGLVVILAWLLVALALGIYRFERIDL
jgi:ABC-2 type transport system permease protein